MSQETKLILIIGAVSTVILIAAAILLGKSPQTAVAQPAKSELLTHEDSYKIATSSAKVTLVEFGDFECPACGAEFPIVEKILNDYQGKINFVFRNFPLTIHRYSQISAQAAEAAGNQGKFWEMYHLLYQNQNEWSTSADPLNEFEKYASSLNLDVEKFKQEVKSNKYSDRIQRDLNDGNSLGVTGTPTFYVNGIVVGGGGTIPTYNDLKTKIENELAK